MISTIFVVILHDMCFRTIKVRSSSGSINEYVRLVEAYRDNGKVKQRTLADLGRKEVLVEILPKLQRFLGGDRADTGEAEDPDILDASTWGPVLAVRALFDQLGLWTILDAASVRPRVCRSPIGRSSWSPIGSSGPPANIAWPAGWRLTSSAIAGATSSSYVAA